MSAISTALVVGGGPAGGAAAALLADGGIAVELVEIRAQMTASGSGITLQGNALRVLRQVGIWPQIEREGFAFTTLALRAPDENATILVELDDVRSGGPDLPATLGMTRPRLAELLRHRAAAAGAKVRLGVAPTGLEQDDTGVDVKFSDGTAGRYDVVIGADGVRSSVRGLVGIKLVTESTGMGIWRAFTPRPKSVVRTELVYGGPAYIAGYCPVSAEHLYAYLVEDARPRTGIGPAEQLVAMRDLAASYHGPWDEIRQHLTEPSLVNYAEFETHLLDGPWHRGRVVLIGDAVHVCPPTLAQGAAMALEDAQVVAELLVTRTVLDDELWAEFTARRLDRVRTVVNASLQLGDWLSRREQRDVPALVARIAAFVAQPT